MSPLVVIALNFGLLSLVAVGGVNVVLPEVHRVVVDVHRWLTPARWPLMVSRPFRAPPHHLGVRAHRRRKPAPPGRGDARSPIGACSFSSTR